MENEITTHKILREFVKGKFGSVRRFLDVAGLGKSELKFIHRSDDKISSSEFNRINAMGNLAKNMNPEKDKKDLSIEEINALRKCIWEVYGGTKKMGEENIDWSESASSNLVNFRRKRRSKRVVNLMHLLLNECCQINDLSEEVEILKKGIISYQT